MTTQTLSTVTLETIENFRHAAALSVKTYRNGGHRLIDAVNNGLQRQVYSRTRQVAPRLTNTLMQVRGGLTDVIVLGLDTVSTQAERAIALSSNTAAKGVTQVAGFVAGVENRVAANGIGAVARLTLPGAQVARALSAQVVRRVDRLSHVVSGKPAKAARAAGAAKKTAVRATRGAVRQAAAAPRKAVAKTQTVLARGKRRLSKRAAA